MIAGILNESRGLSRIEDATGSMNDLPTVYGYKAYHKKDKFLVYGGDPVSSDIAFSKLLGEFLERQQLCDPYFTHSTKDISLSELKSIFNVNFPYEYHEFTESQNKEMPEIAFNMDHKIRAIKVKDIITNKNVLYPESIFFYGDWIRGEKFILKEANSNGAAGGFTVEMARKNALYELIERDAFLLFWYTKSKAQEILIDENFGDRNLSLINRVHKYGISFRFYNITSDISVPTVLLKAVDNLSKDKKVFVTCSTRSSFEEAINVVINEGYQMLHIFDKRMNLEEYFYDFDKNEIDLDLGRVNAHERVRVTFGKNSNIMDFLEGEKISLKELKDLEIEDKSSSILEKMKQAISNINVYEYISKDPLLKQIGYVVLKEYSPQMLSLYLRERFATPISRRIEQFKKHKGDNTPYVINNFPHPYP